MKGASVLVRAFGGVPLARKVWGEGQRVIYITDDEGFKRLAAGRAIVSPVGFPKEDVFQFDDRLFRRLESAVKRRDTRNLPGIWSEAKPYKSDV
jgi:hypothetical protein